MGQHPLSPDVLVPGILCLTMQMKEPSRPSEGHRSQSEEGTGRHRSVPASRLVTGMLKWKVEAGGGRGGGSRGKAAGAWTQVRSP